MDLASGATATAYSVHQPETDGATPRLSAANVRMGSLVVGGGAEGDAAARGPAAHVAGE